MTDTATITKPTHGDADLMLRVYELRREAVMRDARNAINSQFWPKSYDDVLAVTKGDHPLNAAWRQVSSYWEMIYSFARHGVVEPNFWVESNGEGVFLFAKVAPYLERLRHDVNPVLFRNAQWVAEHSAEGRRLLELFQGRVAKVLETR